MILRERREYQGGYHYIYINHENKRDGLKICILRKKLTPLRKRLSRKLLLYSSKYCSDHNHYFVGKTEKVIQSWAYTKKSGWWRLT